MNKSTCALMLAVSALTGCSTNSSFYHDQPLVAKVATGMSREQVLQIGGTPDAESNRTVVPGTCFDYLLSQPGQKRQPYMVSFDQAGHGRFRVLMPLPAGHSRHSLAARRSLSLDRKLPL